MTSVIEDNFEELLKEVPNFLSVGDLIQTGLYPSPIAVYKAKERGEAPPCIHISIRKIRFPKNALICWLRERAALSKK